MTLGTGEHGRGAQSFQVLHSGSLLLRDLDLDAQPVRYRVVSLRRARLIGQFDEGGRDVAHRQNLVYFDIVDRAARHTRYESLVGILDDRLATTRLDCSEPGRAVVERPGEDNADDPRTETQGS